ncbi:MAG: YbaB/EbfC family nucleoid-associated protein [Planctomycetes bacterium]|nr:YbaB/EbfC family nucleoid-associated protein [Planctomycetota bacterium]
MFEKIGQIASLLTAIPRMQEEMGKLQAKVASITGEGEAGGGLVKAKVNGTMELISLTISDQALKDKELLEDMIRAAVNQATSNAKKAVAVETAKMAASLGLPAGFQLPFGT